MIISKKLLGVLVTVAISGILSTSVEASSPSSPGQPALIASRANCWAILHRGAGYYNESISWDPNMFASHVISVFTAQYARNFSAVRTLSTGKPVQTWRSYAGFTDKKGSAAANAFWRVEGYHNEVFSTHNKTLRYTVATTCNLGQGWPWSNV